MNFNYFLFPLKNASNRKTPRRNITSMYFEPSLLKSSINANSIRGCETTSSNFSPFSRLFYWSCEFMATQSLATDSIPNGRKEEKRAPELRNCLRTAPYSFRFSGRANLLRDFMFSYLGDCNITL